MSVCLPCSDDPDVFVAFGKGDDFARTDIARA